jgi:hypothetical protein
MCKVFTATELQNKTKSELSAIFRMVTQELHQSDPDTSRRRNFLASLDNINKAMAKPLRP